MPDKDGDEDEDHGDGDDEHDDGDDDDVGHEDEDEDDDDDEKVPPRGLLYLFLDNVGAFFGHKANVTEGLHYNHCINLEIFWPQTLRCKKVQKGLIFSFVSSSTLYPCHSLSRHSSIALWFGSWLGFRALFSCVGHFLSPRCYLCGVVPSQGSTPLGYGNPDESPSKKTRMFLSVTFTQLCVHQKLSQKRSEVIASL